MTPVRRGSGGPRRLRLVRVMTSVGLVVAALGVSACTQGGATPDPTSSATAVATTDSATPSPSDTASPGTASPGTASPDTASPATPGGTASPGTPGPSGSATPSGGAVLVTCASVSVVRTGRIVVNPLRTTEVATVVSDGRNLTPGTRQQTDFLTPALTAPGGAVITDRPTLEQVATLVDGQKHRVLLDRPAAPDESVDASRRPFSSPGTYAIYNASAVLSAEAVVQCAGQEQTWTFTAEADPATGQINCAVEPARSNALPRAVFATNC